MTEAAEQGGHRRGPRRQEGEPSGPEEVRRAVLDAAAALFVERGVDRVSLRDIAAAANVHPTLIGRYIGHRDELLLAVFDDLSAQLASAVLENPLSGQGFGPDTVMGKWTRVAWSVGDLRSWDRWSRPVQPGHGDGRDVDRGYGLDREAARLRAAQIVAAALGWRIFEDYLIEAGELDAVPLDVLRDELARSARRLGATPWPSPPDPSPQPR